MSLFRNSEDSDLAFKLASIIYNQIGTDINGTIKYNISSHFKNTFGDHFKYKDDLMFFQILLLLATAESEELYSIYPRKKADLINKNFMDIFNHYLKTIKKENNVLYKYAVDSIKGYKRIIYNSKNNKENIFIGMSAIFIDLIYDNCVETIGNERANFLLKLTIDDLSYNFPRWKTCFND